MRPGQVAIWAHRRYASSAAAEIEALGFGAIWLGGSPSLDEAREVLVATSAIPIATGILNIWQYEPRNVAVDTAALRADFPDRFRLGLGAGHREMDAPYTAPLTAISRYLDELDDASPAVRSEDRVIAALGPKMLDLAARRSRGTHPYFVTPDHTRYARDRVGPEPLVAPELAVVLEPDPTVARQIARDYAALYLGLTSYRRMLMNFGFTERDLRGGGSDRLIDAVVPHGSAERILESVLAHCAAGADQVCLQPLGDEPPRRAYRLLASALL